ncbi:WD40 repeat domain-containing protein, partial [Singulisphaera rosea]
SPGRGVHLWDVATGRLRWWANPNRSTPPAALTFAKDGATLLTLWRDGSARRFEVVTGRELDAEAPKLSIEKDPMFGENLVERAQYSPDGTTLAVSGMMGSEVSVVDVETGKPLFHERARTLAFSQDSKTLLVSTHVSSRTEMVDGRTHIGQGVGILRLLDAATGRHRLEIKRPDSSLGSAALSPDGTLLAVAMTEDKASPVIRLFDTADGRERFVLRGHDGFVSKLVFTPDGRSLISSSRDTTVLVWDVPKMP